MASINQRSAFFDHQPAQRPAAAAPRRRRWALLTAAVVLGVGLLLAAGVLLLVDRESPMASVALFVLTLGGLAAIALGGTGAPAESGKAGESGQSRRPGGRAVRVASIVAGAGCLIGAGALLLADPQSVVVLLMQVGLLFAGSGALAFGVVGVLTAAGDSPAEPPRLPARREWRIRPAFVALGLGFLFFAVALPFLVDPGSEWITLVQITLVQMTLAVPGVGLLLYGLWPVLVAAARAEKWFTLRMPHGWDILIFFALLLIGLGAVGQTDPQLAVRLIFHLGLGIAALALVLVIWQGIRLYTGRAGLTSEPPAVPPDPRAAGPRDAAPGSG